MRGQKARWHVTPGVLAFSLVLILFLGAGLFQCASRKVGDPAPDFVFPTIDGQTVQLSKLRGQPVLINFWATWCPPCRAEMPYIQAAFEEKGQEVEFIGVNLEEDLERVRQFAEERGLSFTMALDSEGKSWDTYNIRGLPETFLVDEEGIIRHKKVGPFQSKEEVISMLNIL